MTFDPTISLGTIIAACSVVGAVVGCYVSIVRQLAEQRAEVRELRTMVRPLWRQFVRDDEAE